MLKYLLITISALVILFYTITIVLLIKCKKMVTKDLSQAFIFIMFSILVLILIRILNLFGRLEIIKTYYFPEILPLIASFFILIGIFYFCKVLKKNIEKNKR